MKNPQFTYYTIVWFLQIYMAVFAGLEVSSATQSTSVHIEQPTTCVAWHTV
jgi:hypothetical protein